MLSIVALNVFLVYASNVCTSCELVGMCIFCMMRLWLLLNIVANPGAMGMERL